MRRLILMAILTLGYATTASAQLSGPACYTGYTGFEVGASANWLSVEASGRASRAPACVGRLRIETWIDYPSDCFGTDVHDLGTVCETTGTDWQLSPPELVLRNWAKSSINLSGFIGWQHANLKGFYIHTATGQWHGPRNKRASAYVEDPNANSQCSPWEDGNGNGIPGEWDDCYPSPIILPLGKDPVRLTSARRGVRFDIDADGTLDQVAWTAPTSRWAFLALDRNGNGTIDDGSELFGDHTLPGVTNGFTALDKMSESTDGYLDTEPLMARLLLWEDANHDGISQADELQPAASVLLGINLGAIYTDKIDQHGNLFKLAGYADYKPGHAGYRAASRRVIYDVWFMTLDPNDATPDLTRGERRRQKWAGKLQQIDRRERTKIALRNVW